MAATTDTGERPLTSPTWPPAGGTPPAEPPVTNWGAGSPTPVPPRPTAPAAPGALPGWDPAPPAPPVPGDAGGPIGWTAQGSLDVAQLPPTQAPGTLPRVHLVTETRPFDALLTGLAAAALAGFAWWAVVATTQRQIYYGAVLLGFLVGHGVLIGARRGGVVPAIFAATIALAALVVAEYFIARSIAISELGIDIPLWTDLATAVDVVRASLDEQATTAIFWLLAAAAAGWIAGSTKRRPVI